ncbi:nickel pincer cofactor biosynthesis protein LarB, partial [Candidatus Omnitrophota bacterium]
MQDVKGILKSLKRKKISVNKAAGCLKSLPYQDIGFAKIDNHRVLRRGFPEVIFGKGKTVDEVVKIAKRIIKSCGILLITHANNEMYTALKKVNPAIKYEKRGRIIHYSDSRAKKKDKTKKGTVLIITAGTADLPAALEAKITLELMGDRVESLYDVGVAGLHRLLDKMESIEKASVIIVVAGMEGALPSVVSGLVSKPVIAVPTSVGYGASFEGIAPLLTMMNSCSPGVTVVNIDNGFGAAYFASLVNR